MSHPQRQFLLRVLSTFAAAAVLGAACLAGEAPSPTPAAPEPSAAKLAEYAKRLSDVSPRDAEGFYQLGLWCDAQGLKDKAIRAYEEAIRIDPDHPQARAALGYRPHGTEWTKEAGPKPRQSSGEGEAASPAPRATGIPNPAVPPSTPGGSAAPKEAPAPKAPEPKAKPTEAEPKAQGLKVEDPCQAKKRWIQDAAAKLDMKFSIWEDEDFVVYTTYESSSPRVKSLAATLKGIKTTIANLIGRPKGPFWPGKMHFILLRASTECMRFSETIDEMKFPEDEGYYTGGDAAAGYHTVFNTIPEKALGFLLGHTALDRMGNSDRHVGTWIRDGVGGLVAGSTDEGKKERFLEQAFRRTAAEIQANFDGVTIFKLLEGDVLDEKRRGSGELQQAEALTLVFYLHSLGGSKLSQLIQSLKSPEAPEKPAVPDKNFLIQYAGYQEKVITTVYRDKLEKLNDKWKAFVTAKAAEIEKTSKPDPGSKTGKTTGGKKTNPGTGKTTGKKN